MKRLLIALLTFSIVIVGSGLGAAAQQPPSTEIFIADLQTRNGRLQVSRPVNITNREGYDNQPAFLPDGTSLLFTSVREGTLPDIFRYNFSDQSIKQVTATAEGEYSPTPIGNGASFSVIRVEADRTQRLWKFAITGDQPQLVLENIKPVGYHCWLDETTLALFVLGEPPTLQLADTRTGKAEIIEHNIGRSLQKHPLRAALTFVHKVSESEWWIKELDLKSRTVKPIIKTLAGNEDFVWTPAGVVLMASGAKLYQFDPAKDRDWTEIADFMQAGLKRVTRLALNPKGDRLALVAVLQSEK